VERRRERSEAIVRDILRHRHVWERPTPSCRPSRAYEGLRGLDGEFEIRVRRPARAPVGIRGHLVDWLFHKGVMCPVLIFGLIACGLIAAVLGAR